MILVIGLGFVGLTTALGFSEKGFKVTGFDIDEKKMDLIQNSTLPFFEKGLDTALTNNINKNFTISRDLQQSVASAKIIFYCVGTPGLPDGSANLQYLEAAIQNTCNNLKNDSSKILVIKSTVPPGSSQLIKNFIKSHFNEDIYKRITLVNNPEFLREGMAWDDFMNPDRIVIGSDGIQDIPLLQEIYKPFHAPIYFTSYNTSEFIKYMSNTLLATLISFSNEMSMIAGTIGNIDIKNAFEILHKDKRWIGNPAPMTSYVYPGCGYGGYCLPKDTEALSNLALHNGYESKILQATIQTNEEIIPFLLKKIKKEINISDKIGILGLSFKAESDDVRNTPAFDIINLLLQCGYTNIYAYDPLAMETFQAEYNLPIKYVNSTQELIHHSEVVILTTKDPLYITYATELKTKKLFDLRYSL